MNYCPACGAKVRTRVPPGDKLPRAVCDQCGEIHYVNPKLVVGTLPVWGDQVLLCKRAIEPRLGKWTLPAGFMEMAESTEQAALRETSEEACASVTLQGLFALISIAHIGQVHLIYRARLDRLDFAPGDETSETRLFSEAEIPWDQLAFRSIEQALRHYFADRSAGQFRYHELALLPPDTHLP